MKRVLTDEEWRRLELAVCERYRRFNGPAPAERWMVYLLARWTGLRALSLSRLTCCDVVSVSCAAGPMVCLNVAAVKYSPGRRLPLPADLARAVFWKLRRTACGRGGRLLPLPRDANRMLDDDLAAAGIEPETAAGRFTFHCLRVMCAVDMRRAGLSLLQIKAWLGHRDQRTTERYLVDPGLDELVNIAAARTKGGRYGHLAAAR